ncbi:MAG: sialidase family protein [Chloroherpetonaceae bacterium]|nr:glycoside hydrolase [Chloroherpetonaceae bacterium]MDW8019495.1 sialidase family protein [Chloroherpetonaceae bacterium]
MWYRSLFVCLFTAALIYASTLFWGCSNPSGPSEPGWELGGAVTGSVQNLWADGGTLYVCTSSGIFRSTDTARTWTQVVSSTQLGLAGGFSGGVVARGSTLYVGTLGDFIYFSTNAGATWRQLRGGFTNFGTFVCEGISLIGNRVFCGNNGGTCFRTTFGDTTWVRAFDASGGGSIRAFFNFNDTLYAGHNAGMQRSFDNGTTWSVAPVVGLETIDARRVYAFTRRGNSLYIATDLGVYVSNNSGASWSPVRGLPPAGSAGLGDDARALTTVGNSVIVGMRFEGIWRSTDGINFTDFSQGLDSRAIKALITLGNVVVAASADPTPRIWIRRVQ